MDETRDINAQLLKDNQLTVAQFVAAYNSNQRTNSKPYLIFHEDDIEPNLIRVQVNGAEIVGIKTSAFTIAAFRAKRDNLHILKRLDSARFLTTEPLQLGELPLLEDWLAYENTGDTVISMLPANIKMRINVSGLLPGRPRVHTLQGGHATLPSDAMDALQMPAGRSARTNGTLAKHLETHTLLEPQVLYQRLDNADLVAGHLPAGELYELYVRSISLNNKGDVGISAGDFGQVSGRVPTLVAGNRAGFTRLAAHSDPQVTLPGVSLVDTVTARVLPRLS